jgi:hypothetical protein
LGAANLHACVQIDWNVERQALHSLPGRRWSGFLRLGIPMDEGIQI